MKYVIVILDGAADWKLPELGDRTTLAAANTTMLDMMASEGMAGLSRTVPVGMEVSSNAACTSILGYDPVANFIGRGAIEATAQGIKLAEDEVAMRINTISIQEGLMASYHGDGISTEESTAMIARLGELLNDNVFTFYPGKAYRHILVVKGHPEICDFEYTPPHDISDQPVTDKELPQGEGRELLWHLMHAAHEALKDDPINAQRIEQGKLPITDIWPYWPGSAPTNLAPIEEARGLRACMTSSVDLLRGMAVLFGINFMEIEGVTDGLDNNFGAQAEAAIAALENDEADLAIVHVEAPDEMGHRGDIDGKIMAVERIDRDIMTRLFAFAKKMSVKNGGPGLRILAMPDHFTPLETKTHEDGAVPFFIWGDNVEANGAEGYCEDECAKTGLVLDPDGYRVMDLLLK